MDAVADVDEMGVYANEPQVVATADDDVTTSQANESAYDWHQPDTYATLQQHNRTPLCGTV